MSNSGGTPAQIAGNSAPGPSQPGAPTFAMQQVDAAGETWNPVVAAGTLADGATGRNSAATALLGQVSGSTFDRLRTPNVFKTAQITGAGASTIWTPATGKKFRLMRGVVFIDENASFAVAGLLAAVFQDSGAAIGLTAEAFVPAAALTTTPGGVTLLAFDLGNGFLSAAANNVLQLNVNTALATGALRVNVAGTEE